MLSDQAVRLHMIDVMNDLDLLGAACCEARTFQTQTRC